MIWAFLAPGQGSRDLVHVVDFARKLARGKDLLDHAAAIIDLPVVRWLDQGGRHLEPTETLQPVLTAISLVIADELKARGVEPHYVAGHSLGEIAAVAIGGWISYADAVSIAAMRGRLMAREAQRHTGGLLALLEKNDLERALKIGKSAGWVEFGAENAPDEIVLSGNDVALRAIAAACSSRRLAVVGPWHSSAMADAVDELRNALSMLNHHSLRTQVVLNRNGQALHTEEQLPTYLAEQLTRPVFWSKTLETMKEAKVTHFVTLGPGAVLRALVRKNLGTAVQVWNADGEASLRSLVEARNG